MTLKKEHMDAIGLAYYTAIGTTSDWDKLTTTGSLITLLMVSVLDAKNKEHERLVSLCQTMWGEALMDYQREESRLHSFWLCQTILGKIGTLAYQYGNTPAGGFKLIPAPQEGGKS